ncbi:hypothetical protein ABID26_005524 [Mesorhizobium shonense]|uniref:GNAT family N-acetyltransferase n=1 Tax=Mesorhizobium shonense TaxID=1209948 RepID=A0ABV2I1B1_9HYPH
MEQNSLHISHARRDDLPTLLDLYQHLAPGDARPMPDRAEEVFDQFMAFGGSAILIGEVGGVLAASCSLVVVPNLTRGGSPYMD